MESIDDKCAYKKLEQLDNKTFNKCKSCDGYKTIISCVNYVVVLNIKYDNRGANYDSYRSSNKK